MALVLSATRAIGDDGGTGSARGSSCGFTSCCAVAGVFRRSPDVDMRASIESVRRVSSATLAVIWLERAVREDDVVAAPRTSADRAIRLTHLVSALAGVCEEA